MRYVHSVIRHVTSCSNQRKSAVHPVRRNYFLQAREGEMVPPWPSETPRRLTCSVLIAVTAKAHLCQKNVFAASLGLIHNYIALKGVPKS